MVSHSASVDSGVYDSNSQGMAWVVCLSAGLFFFYEFFQLNIFDVINQDLREAFNLDARQLSWMSSAYLWADILFLLPAGILLDRYSTRSVILISMLLCVLGTLGFALTHSFFLATFFHFISGIGNAFCFLSCVVLVSHWFLPRKQALVIGSLVTMAFMGGMMAHTPFAFLNELLGWRQALFIDGLVGALLLFWIYLVVQDRPTGRVVPVTTLQQKQILASFTSALKCRQNWLAGAFTSLLNLPIMVLCALWGVSYLQVVHHLPDLAASNVVSLIFAGSVIGCPLLGWVSDYLGRRKPLMIFGAVTTLLTTIPLLLPLSLSQTILSLLFFAIGFFSATQIISYPLIAESNEASNTGAATAVASVLIMGGGGVGQVLFGWLMTQHASSSKLQYGLADFQFAMWMFPLSAVAALLAVLLTKETYCKSYQKRPYVSNR